MKLVENGRELPNTYLSFAVVWAIFGIVAVWVFYPVIATLISL